jgi:NAD(P)-dependent dehydrogenase (short-subunit alcohol dehydrogenase family)
MEVWMPANQDAAVVTGAASGIGLAIVRRMAAAGRPVVMADLDGPALDSAAADLREGGARVTAVPTDVSDPDAVEELARIAVHEFGLPQIVCNNAGVNAYGFRTWEAPPATWQWIWSINVLGVVNGIRSFVPLLIERGDGHVLNTASVAGLASHGNSAPYASTKHAVVAISESLRDELAQAAPHVRVSVICPGLIATNIGKSARLWPDRLGPSSALGPNAPDHMHRLETSRASAPGPDMVADAVARAIKDHRFLVFTDEETRENARANRAAIFAETDTVRHAWS